MGFDLTLNQNHIPNILKIFIVLKLLFGPHFLRSRFAVSQALSMESSRKFLVETMNFENNKSW